MKKFFCDKCYKEMEINVKDGMIQPIISGSFFLINQSFLKSKRHTSKVKIWVDWESRDETIEHLCKECLFDELKKMDIRSPTNTPNIDEDDEKEYLDKVEEESEYKDELFFEEEKEVPYKQLKCTSKKRS